MSCFSQRKELIDALLSSSVAVLSHAEGPLSLAPIPGLPMVASTLLKLVEMVQETRNNSAECLQLAQSLQDLVDFLNSTSEKIQKQIGADSSIKDSRAVAAALQRSQSLADRVEDLSSSVNKMLRKIQTISKGNAIQRFLRSSEDAATLKSLNDQVQQAQSSFQLQGTISIEIVVNEIVKSAQMAELERDLISIRTVDAGYRAPVNGRKSKWLEGTRTKLLRDIEDWSAGLRTDATGENARIFVLTGAAGTGKSTIAVQVAKTLEKAGALGGSFFFERGVEELSATRYVFPTLAVQLARSNNNLASFIADGISKHRKNGNTQHMSYALDELLVEPLRLVPQEQWPPRPIVFVLDALDECGEQSQVPEMLYLLLKRMRSLPFPLRLFITTRPEYHIQDAFASLEWKSEPEPFHLHSIPTEILTNDIRRFIEHRLRELEIVQDIIAIQTDAIDRLTDAASGLFIYAATCLEFLHQYKRDLRRSLGLVLGHALNVDTLDKLYHIVLLNAFSENTMRHPDLGQSVPAVLGALAVLQNQLLPDSLCELLELRAPTLSEILERLRSVLTFSMTQPIRLLHASFPQYLVDPTRCHIPRISDNPSFRGHDQLAVQCLKTLLHGNNLKRNICDLEDPLEPVDEIPDLNERLTISLPPHVQYACLHWATHLSSSTLSLETAKLFKEFTEKKMLYWMEALGMMGQVESAVLMFTRILDWYRVDDDTRTLLNDGHRFILTFMDAIQMCPSQVYVAGLAFSPSRCLLRKVYDSEVDVVDLLAGQDETWGACLRVMEAPTNTRHTPHTAFSHDGQWITSASDFNVNVWDSSSGSLLRTLSGHRDWVSQSTFSPDDTVIVSSDASAVIRVWNSVSGAPLRIISLAERPMSFSLPPNTQTPEGTQKIAVVFGSGVQVFDTQALPESISEPSSFPLVQASGLPMNTQCLAVSSSGSGSIFVYDMNNYFIWDGIQSHAVEIVPQLNLLVTGSSHTVRLWNIRNQECVHAFEGHTGSVDCVAVSPSNRIIASGSTDCTVRLWGIEDKTCLAILNGRCGLVKSVAFSPNGDRLVAGGSDGKLPLWDINNTVITTERSAVPEFVQASWTCSLSPDGRFLTTSNDDERGNTVGANVWSIQDNQLLATIMDDSHGLPGTISASQDGAWVSTLWDDNIIRLTNVMTKDGSQRDKCLTISRSHIGRIRGVSVDGRFSYLCQSYPGIRQWYRLDWEAAMSEEVDEAVVPPEFYERNNRHERYIEESGWLFDQWSEKIVCWIPTVYRGDLSWTFYDEDEGPKYFSLNTHKITVLDLKPTKYKDDLKADATPRWKTVHSCLRRALAINAPDGPLLASV